MRYLLFLLTLTTPIFAFAQSNGYTRQILGTRDGLLSPKIFSLLQDANGYLWIGSEIGVSRYNGYEFDNLQYTADNNQIGKILCIAQDSCMGIWMGGDKGLFYYRNDTLQQIMIKGRADIAVESMAVDAAGDLWIGELNFLYKLDNKQVALQAKKNSLTINVTPFISYEFRAISLSLDTYDNLYAAGYLGVFSIDKSQHLLNKLWNNPTPRNEALSVAAISPDSLLFNCNNGPITALIKGKPVEMKKAELIGSRVFRNKEKMYGLSSKTVEVYAQAGLQKLFNFGALTNHVTSAIIDKEGNIWIGSWEGLLKFSSTAFTIYNLPTSKNSDFFSLIENNNGQAMVGGNGGQLYNCKNNNIEPLNNLQKPFERAEIKCIYQHTDGSYWFGSGYEGITRIKNNKRTNWNEENILPDNTCDAFYKTKDNQLFACTEKGVVVINPDSAQPIGVHYTYQKKYTRSPKLLGCFEVAGEYFFYGNQGLFRLKNKQLISDSIKGFAVKALYINSITTDGKENIWIATQGKGLLQCKFENKAIVLQKQWLQQDGLASDIILSVLADKKNRIWLSGYAGISLLSNELKNNRIVNFSSHDGLLTSYYEYLRLAQLKNGTIFGLSSMGIFSFHPDSINTNTVKPSVLLTELLVNKTNTDGKKYSRKINANYSTSLDHSSNSLQFFFTAISLTDPEKIVYAYRLISFDNKWTTTKSRQASFSFLPSGNYTFELMACNNSNVWTTPIQYSFVIKPPFWQTWWFRISSTLLLAFALLFIVKRRINAIKKDAAINQQMAELEAKALRAQMNPHFIFNSLNAIQECIVTEKIEAAYEYLSKFSRLLRLVLNNSELELITLASEIEMTRLYLSLESLRFRQSFIYTITIDENLDTDFIKIPSMLVQPFVENAVWHGLRHKAGEKKLSVLFTEKNNHLIIDIEDNGVGREKAAFIKKQKIGSDQFNSKGSVLSQQRLDILNRQYPMLAKIEITDLKDFFGDATGTRVSIQLPLDLQKQTTK